MPTGFAEASLVLAGVALAIWIYLIFAHGRFWSSTPELKAVADDNAASDWPDIDIVVPARDEAETIGVVIESLLRQAYRGHFTVTLVDDESTDATATIVAQQPNYKLLRGTAKPPGWSGKLWALHQGIASGAAPFVLCTDADIVHHPKHLQTLVWKIQNPALDMVSEMVRLNCESLAERLLVPAFVYFFQMLYPFAWVNDPTSRIAAGAGGTVLIRRAALTHLGGIAAIKHALIDDVSLARAVKRFGPIYLGHSRLATSIRRYPHFRDIWEMIARTAFTQLRYSALILVFTLLGLTLTWLVPVAAALGGHRLVFIFGICACALAGLSFLPTLLRYERNPLLALTLPFIAMFYMAATLGSAFDYWWGAGAHWKKRAYGGSQGEAP